MESHHRDATPPTLSDQPSLMAVRFRVYTSGWKPIGSCETIKKMKTCVFSAVRECHESPQQSTKRLRFCVNLTVTAPALGFKQNSLFKVMAKFILNSNENVKIGFINFNIGYPFIETGALLCKEKHFTRWPLVLSLLPQRPFMSYKCVVLLIICADFS